MCCFAVYLLFLIILWANIIYGISYEYVYNIITMSNSGATVWLTGKYESGNGATLNDTVLR